MTLAGLPPLFAEGVTRTTLELGRIQSNADWILPVLACAAALGFVIYMYIRDGVELPRVLVCLLAVLRMATFLALLVFYLQPQWRTEQEKVINSRAVLLVDTSMSMGLADAKTSPGSDAPKRIEQVAAALEQTDFLDQLRRTHEVTVLQFNDELHRDRVVALGKGEPRPEVDDPGVAADGEADAKPDAEPAAPRATPQEPVDWKKFLALGGTETRLGGALRQLVHEEGNSPLSAVLVFSDGGQNAGISPTAAIEAAREAKVPVFAFGIGSERQPARVRVAAFSPPPRAYPGDPYSVGGVIQAWRMAGRVVTVQLLSRDADAGSTAADAGSGTLIDSQQVILGGDGEEVPVKFEVTPEQAGRRTLCLKIAGPKSGRGGHGSFLEADIEIIDRKNRVLLIAGGPMREYRFLRNQLHRDRSTTLDVLLQTARPGISQDADTLLGDFPATREEMYRYDCVVAFDPDWQALSVSQIDLLESWVAEQGGGLVVVGGPVFAGEAVNSWVQDSAMSKIRALYPVEFPRRFSVLADSMYVSEDAWPLDFTREGLDAEFLWLEDTATAGRRAWEAFRGVYSFCPVRGQKQGATVLARFSDPRSARGGEQPVYFAWHFYGSGRVFFLGSGEMWRLRAVDESYFEQFYTKLIRHVSKGRLLRGSSRGILLVSQERYWLGSTVEVRAYRLTNSQLEPLKAPGVGLQVIQPDRTVQTVKLRSDPARAGSYVGQFAVLQEGDYRLELPVPESDDERLTRSIKVEIPNLEIENPRRNDALLSRIAKDTDGKYYVGLKAILEDGGRSVLEQLKDKTKTIILTAPPDRLWEETWLRWMMIALCTLLCLEWLIRRLLKLA